MMKGIVIYLLLPRLFKFTSCKDRKFQDTQLLLSRRRFLYIFALRIMIAHFLRTQGRFLFIYFILNNL